MLLVVHKRVHSLIRLFCFVGEYLRPGQGLRTPGQKGGQSRRHRRRRRGHRRRLRLGQAGLRRGHVGAGRLHVVGRTVSCPTRRRRSDQRQHGGGEGVVAALVGGRRSLRLERCPVGSSAGCGVGGGARGGGSGELTSLSSPRFAAQSNVGDRRRMDHPTADKLRRRSSSCDDISESKVVRHAIDMDPDHPSFLRAIGLLSTSEPKQDVGRAPVSAASGAEAVEAVVRAGGVCDDECAFLERIDDLRERYHATFPDTEDMTIWTYKTVEAGTTAATTFPITSIKRSVIPRTPDMGRKGATDAEGIIKWEVSPERSGEKKQRSRSLPKDRAGEFAYQFWCSGNPKKSFFDYVWADGSGHFHWVPPPLNEFVGEDDVSAAANKVEAEAADNGDGQQTPIKENDDPYEGPGEDNGLRRRRPRCRRRRCPSDEESDILPLIPF
jgi:hypothetical protein